MKSLYLLPFYELYVDVEDKPGMISLVTTILGHSDINIKNIRVINSREDEPGCLVLSLDDKRSVEKAQSLLRGVGLKANVR
jgi:prephenate dehydrogenase